MDDILNQKRDFGFILHKYRPAYTLLWQSISKDRSFDCQECEKTNNHELLNWVETGSLLTSALALTLLNHRTSGAILMAVSEFIEQPSVTHSGGKTNAE